MNRREWAVWRIHIIRRSYRDPQYGMMLWGWHNNSRVTFDVWVHTTLWTFRWLGE